MERLLLLWDELDEILGYGRHLAVGLLADLRTPRPQAAPKRPALNPAHLNQA